jgi:capsular exopolysaccharide synthesis family protein
MSKFFKAHQQVQRDHGVRGETTSNGARREDVRPSPPPTTAAPRTPAPVTENFWGVDEHLVSLVTPAAFEAEQYRALRHVVEQLHRTADMKVVAVSSAASGDGKTVTALNLAGALAQSPDARVLVVDGDLRRPSLDRRLGMTDPGRPGLVDAIVNPAVTLDDVVERRPPFNLSVIRAGQTPPSPYELLKAPRLGELLQEARARYDYVIVDTPPLTPVQDCRIVGRWVDGFLVVVAAHRTPRRLVKEALTRLDQAKIIGFVFNRDSGSLSRHYDRYQRAYVDATELSANGGHPGALRRVVKSLGRSLRERPED